MSSEHLAVGKVGSSKVRSTGGRRIGLLDIPWEGHWTAIAMTPVSVPSAARLGNLLLRFLAENPTSPLAGSVDAKSRRWVPVPAAGREEFVRRVIVEADDPDPDGMSDFIDRHRPAPDSDVPRIVVGDHSLCLYHSHIYGDASSFAQLVVHLALGDTAGMVAMEPRAGLGLAVRALVRQPRSSYREWGSLALRPVRRLGSRRRHAEAVATRSVPSQQVPPVTAAHVPAGDGRTAFADAILTNVQLRDLTRWRNQHCKGVSLTSVLTAATHRALIMEGVAMNPVGYYSLFDIRRYVSSDSNDAATRFGNLAKSVLLDADMTDPRAIGTAMEQVIESGRALPGLVMGALATAIRRPAHGTGTVPDGPVTLSFVSMPTLPGLAEVPWLGSETRRYCGVGYPVGRLGISVFAIRLRGHMEISASFDSTVLDPAAVRRALHQLSDPAVLSQLTLPATTTETAENLPGR